MGFRTVVILHNDRASDWANDPLLGKKIAVGMNYAMNSGAERSPANLNYGQVVECVHTDTQTLAVIDGLSFTSLARQLWNGNENDEAIKMKFLKSAARSLGYRLTKLPKEKNDAPR